ncbi:hypothetical protein Hanom_Chr09g00802961 [Helianthus anomalus]
MKYKPYKATKARFKDWSIDALREEIDRITKINNDPLVKKTVPIWNKCKQFDPDDALRFERMRAELVAAGYGFARSVARWSKLNVEETYKNLEELRKKDQSVSQKPVYPETTTGRPQQTHAFKKFSLASASPTNALNQLKR